jgi:hypothetical protein
MTYAYTRVTRGARNARDGRRNRLAITRTLASHASRTRSGGGGVAAAQT